jgi:hypothetical protein
MANRIPIQKFYDILSNKHPQEINWYDLYQLNKKEIKHIANVFMSTIKDFSQTMKIKDTKYDTEELPQIILHNNEKYIKLPNVEKLISYEYSFNNVLKYLNNLVKNQEFDKIHYIMKNKILDVKKYCYYHHNRCNDSGLYGFIELYIKEYIYFSLLLKDSNFTIQTDEKLDFQYVSYPDKFVLYDIYKHYFNFSHKKLNESIAKKLYYIVRTYRVNEDILTNIVEEKIKEKSLDENFLKAHTKYCFQMIYSVYNIMLKFYPAEELDKKIYRFIKETIMYYFKY